MATKIFVNLPVKDLNKSIEFFTKLGFSFNPQFTDDQATCMIISENIFAMLLVEERFKDFTKKEICDATKSTEVLIALDADSREKVDELVQKAVEAGGSIYAEPQDHGWMYGHSFADLDGHQWEVLYMDESALPKQQTEVQPVNAELH
ncbi:MAG: VOC family protein [Flavisolibacter sp.]|nr:VOC family protein [Flavisolibacter sp.]